jgi:hypothetical protein
MKEEVYGGARMIRTPRFLACFFFSSAGKRMIAFFGQESNSREEPGDE